MAKKFYEDKLKQPKNNMANMPKDVIHKVYPSMNLPLSDDVYVDTQPGLDEEFRKSANKIKKHLYK